jgi:hypothetical protein
METEVMDTTVAVQELTEKVLRLEEEVVELRQLEREVAGLHQEVGELRQRTAQTNGAKIRFVDQEALNRAVDKLFAGLGIEEVEPIGAEVLQKMMAEEGLEPNELSRGIIVMRDE